jgi:hypothetical protein
MGNGGVSCSPSPWGLWLTRALGRFGCSGCSAGAEIPIHPLEGPAGSQAGRRGQFRTYRSRGAYRQPNDLGGGRYDLRTVRQPLPHCAHQSLACPHRPKARPIANTITELGTPEPPETPETPRPAWPEPQARSAPRAVCQAAPAQAGCQGVSGVGGLQSRGMTGE